MEYQAKTADMLFQQLESLTEDPLIVNIFNDARHYEEMVNEVGGATEGERSELINALDARWPFMGASLTVAGRLSFQNQATGEIETAYYDSIDVASNGFCFEPCHIEEDGEIIAERYRIGLHLIKYDDESRQAGKFGVGHIDELVIDFPSQSIEMIENRLRYFHADTMEELDSLILNCNDEESALTALQQFQLSVDPSRDDGRQLVADIQNYLIHVLEFDTMLPYIATVQGPCYCDIEGVAVEATIEKELTCLLGINRIQFMPINDAAEDGRQVHVPCVDVAVFGDDKARTPTHMYIPVTGLSDIVSVRRQTYQKYHVS